MTATSTAPGQLPIPAVIPPVAEQRDRPAVAGVNPVVVAGDG